MKILIFLLFSFLSMVVEAEFLIATCESPEGWSVEYGVKSFTADEQAKLSVGKDGMSGSNPTFFLDLSKLDYLFEITDPIKPEGLSPKVMSELDPRKLKKYPIIHMSSSQISAIDSYKNGIWTFSLFPNFNFLIMSRQTHRSVGNHVVGATYYAKCNFDKK